MSVDNDEDGYNLYRSGNQNQLSWFHDQWKQWPIRVNPNNTTNLSFLYGGIRAYRELHDKTPDISEDLASNIKFLDKYRER